MTEQHGTIVRYTETVPKTGRWAGHGTVQRVYWRAIPSDPAKPITYHRRRRDAVAALAPTGGADPAVSAPAAQALRDRHGDIWTAGDDGLLHSFETAPFPRAHVEKKWGPLVPVTAEKEIADAAP